MSRGSGWQIWSASFVLAALTLTCRTKEPAIEHRDVASEAAPVARPDSALMVYLAYYREWMLLANRQKAEMDAKRSAMDARYSRHDGYTATQDQHFLGLLERQQREMRTVMARAPSGMTAHALDETMPGIGQFITGSQRIAFVPGRNEAVLATSRAKYGDKFVSWVLAHEDTIVATLSRAAR